VLDWVKSIFKTESLSRVEDLDLPVGAIDICQVSKRFRKRTATRKSYTTIKGDLLKLGQVEVPTQQVSNHQVNYLQALEDFSLSIKPGQALGVIGRNGSGKSTLLKLISGIYLPDSGSVKKRGKISALIELGAGFHPDFSGRENIYLGGVMYGLSKKDIDSRFSEIVKYAELEDFIDDPVRTYSSGMYMRLGFSLAVHTDPDILLIDEVLAVGDAGFIHRCQDTISEFKRRGKTLVFVTHDLSSVVRWCDDVVWLDRGKIKERGRPRRVIDAYMQKIEKEEQEKLLIENEELSTEAQQEYTFKTEEELPKNMAEHEEASRWGNQIVEIKKVTMRGDNNEAKWLFSGEEEVLVEVEYQINSYVDDLVMGIGILRVDGLHVHGTNTLIDDLGTPTPDEAVSFPVDGVYYYRMPRLGLVENTYYLDVAVHKEDGTPYDYHHRLHKFSVRSKLAYPGVCVPEHSWEFAPSYSVKTKHKKVA
jgi:ABC-type polysaccharide/polyol phosphate transport system ATPase subunit